MKLSYVLIQYEIVVCVCRYMCTFVYLQTAKASPVRPIGDVTETETHQAAANGDVSVQMRTQRGAERMPVVSELLTCLTR